MIRIRAKCLRSIRIPLLYAVGITLWCVRHEGHDKKVFGKWEGCGTIRHAGLKSILLDMIKTVPPTSKTVDELVDEYRTKLGLRLWPELGHGRRSGRTTHMMLVAIATAVTTGKQVVVSFDEAGFEHSKDDLLITARVVGVNKSMFIVVPHRKAERASHTLRERLVVFSDHYDSRRRAG